MISPFVGHRQIDDPDVPIGEHREEAPRVARDVERGGEEEALGPPSEAPQGERQRVCGARRGREIDDGELVGVGHERRVGGRG